MTTETRDKVITKIQKLKAQSESEAKLGNAAAAEAFASMVNRLLLDNELSMTEVEYAKAKTDEPVEEVLVDLSKYDIPRVKSRVAWQESMAHIVAKAHLCQILVRQGSNSIWFVGTKSHTTVAEYAYGRLVKAASDLSHTEYCTYWWHLKNTTGDTSRAKGFKAAWLSAFIHRLAERFAEAKRASVAETGNSSMALVRLDNALIRVADFVKAKYTKKAGAVSGRSSGNAEGRARGRAAADRVNIGQKGVGGSGGVRGIL